MKSWAGRPENLRRREKGCFISVKTSSFFQDIENLPSLAAPKVLTQDALFHHVEQEVRQVKSDILLINQTLLSDIKAESRQAERIQHEIQKSTSKMYHTYKRVQRLRNSDKVDFFEQVDKLEQKCQKLDEFQESLETMASKIAKNLIELDKQFPMKSRLFNGQDVNSKHFPLLFDAIKASSSIEVGPEDQDGDRASHSPPPRNRSIVSDSSSNTIILRKGAQTDTFLGYSQSADRDINDEAPSSNELDKSEHSTAQGMLQIQSSRRSSDGRSSPLEGHMLVNRENAFATLSGTQKAVSSELNNRGTSSGRSLTQREQNSNLAGRTDDKPSDLSFASSSAKSASNRCSMISFSLPQQSRPSVELCLKEAKAVYAQNDDIHDAQATLGRTWPG
ncbi:LAMI_0E05556g1_1 [Lachancea mirantina]|uniref:LAMI_0E05556g1_1 n=1 Tax=Lachancea mirantina TaxID=1230905 RepID=A0A1G4JL81_9SACH|nr:LAMI_0E05556g1_1 [Lachancea mirantina]